jgi:feruloyl esterase
VQFEMRLPTNTWNGRYMQAGCGGYCGSVNIDSCTDAVARDYMVAAQNMGHVGGAASVPLWATEPGLREDYAYRSTHVVAVAAKAIAERFYGKRPHHAYFRGCSTGGREGMTEAQRYPEDFDGIIAGDAAQPVRQGAMANAWDMRQLLRDDGSAVFTPAKLRVLNDAVLHSCDAVDGVVDGILMDPRDCHFDVATVQCPAAQDGPSCLTAEQVGVARKLYDGPRTESGERLVPGHRAFGSELAWDDPGGLRLGFSKGYGYLGFPAAPDSYDYRRFDYDKDLNKLAEMARFYDSVEPGKAPDLKVFQKRGGKLMLYHGWADPTVPPFGTLDYYSKLTHASGGLKAVQTWARTFMVPGMFHCRGGNAPNTFDMLDALVDWVEHGNAPERIIATQLKDGKVVRTRPLVAYPAQARYTGAGDVNDARNWAAVMPATPRNDDIDWIWAPK